MFIAVVTDIRDYHEYSSYNEHVFARDLFFKKKKKSSRASTIRVRLLPKQRVLPCICSRNKLTYI